MIADVAPCLALVAFLLANDQNIFRLLSSSANKKAISAKEGATSAITLDSVDA